jgi:uncharacterized damage-inducible protein DinB
MNDREFFVKKWEQEQPIFRRVIAAAPADALDYRPHERSMTAGAIIWLLTVELKGAADLLDSGKLDWVETPRPASLAEILELFDSHSKLVREKLAAADDPAWAQTVHFLVGGQPAFSESQGEMQWGFLFDAVHHRGQLSSYLRPMGGKVPSIYGPSADDPGTA